MKVNKEGVGERIQEKVSTGDEIWWLEQTERTLKIRRVENVQESKWAEGETKAKEDAEETKESNGKVDKISRKH